MISQAKTNQNALRDIEIAQISVTGKTYDDIAKQFHISQGRVSQILSKPEMRDIVDTAMNQLVSFVPLAISQFLAILKDPTHSDHYKSIKDSLQSIGILPSHTGGNTYIQNIYNTNQLGTTDEVSRFTETVHQLQDKDIQEAEYSDDTLKDEVLEWWIYQWLVVVAW